MVKSKLISFEENADGSLAIESQAEATIMDVAIHSVPLIGALTGKTLTGFYGVLADGGKVAISAMATSKYVSGSWIPRKAGE